MSFQRLLGTAATSVASQIISSGGNFVLIILAARAGTREEFGAVALATVIYTLLIGLVRSLIGEVVLVRAGVSGSVSSRSMASPSAAYTGAFASATFILVAIYLGPQTEFGVALLLLAASLPALLVLDVERYLAFAAGKPGGAVALDAAWLIMFLAILGILQWDGSNGVWAAWCLAGSAIAVGAALRRGTWVGPLASTRWLRQNADLAGPYLAEFGATSVSSTVPQMILGGVASKQAVGIVRGAASLFGPLTVLYTGGYTGLISHLRGDQRRIMATAFSVSAFLMVVAGGLTIGLVYLPDRIGMAILGESWLSTRPVLVPFGLAMVLSVSAGGALLGLRALQAARASLRVRLAAAPFMLSAQVVGSMLAGARGYTIGLGIGAALSSVLLWAALRGELSSSDGAALAAP